MNSVSREEIFSKDYLTIKDIEVLLGTTYQVAARLIRQIIVNDKEIRGDNIISKTRSGNRFTVVIKRSAL